MKKQLQELIIDNYWKRRNGLLPDEWFWADLLYMSLYPECDYNFVGNAKP